MPYGAVELPIPEAVHITPTPREDGIAPAVELMPQEHVHIMHIGVGVLPGEELLEVVRHFPSRGVANPPPVGRARAVERILAYHPIPILKVVPHAQGHLESVGNDEVYVLSERDGVHPTLVQVELRCSQGIPSVECRARPIEPRVLTRAEIVTGEAEPILEYSPVTVAHVEGVHRS